MLKIKRLDPRAKLPTVGHAGEDLAYDLYAIEDVTLWPGRTILVRTGIAAHFDFPKEGRTFGLLIKDRSSMAMKNITTSAGVIDAGYREEIKVLLTMSESGKTYTIEAGDRFAQMLPTEVFTAESVIEVDDLEQSSRGVGGFGSTGA